MLFIILVLFKLKYLSDEKGMYSAGRFVIPDGQYKTFIWNLETKGHRGVVSHQVEKLSINDYRKGLDRGYDDNLYEEMLQFILT